MVGLVKRLSHELVVLKLRVRFPYPTHIKKHLRENGGVFLSK